MNTIKYIKNWVASKESFSFFLPIGTQGRPFDNQYQIESIIEDKNGLSIKLSGHIEFTFEGELQYRDEVCNLIITGFSRLKFKVNGVVKSEFTKGEFCLTGF